MIGQYNKLEGFVVLRNIQDNRINDDDVQVYLVCCLKEKTLKQNFSF